MAASEKENELLSLAIEIARKAEGNGGALFAVVMMTGLVFLYAVMFNTNFP